MAGVTGQNNVPPDWAGWKKDLLARLGAPMTPANDAFLNAWARKEGGGGQNNPFNTTYAVPGATNLAGNSAGVKNYPIPAEGLAATYFTLQSSFYRDVVADLRAGKASTTKCYSGLRKWSGGGYCSLAGVSTAAPAGRSGTGVVGDTMADQGFGPAYNAGPAGCHLKTHFELPTTPWTTKGFDICWDKPLGVLYVGAGGVLLLAGIAVLMVGAFAETRAGRSAGKALTTVGGGAGATAAAIASQRPTQRRARATAREQQTQADEARRLAPVRAEDRRQTAFASAEARRRTAARRRARNDNQLAQARRDRQYDANIRAEAAAARRRRARLAGPDEPPPF